MTRLVEIPRSQGRLSRQCAGTGSPSPAKLNRLPHGERRWLSVRDVVTEYGLSGTAAYRLKTSIPFSKVRGVGLRFRRNDVEAYLNSFLTQPGIAPRTRVQAHQAKKRPRADTGTWHDDARRFGLL